MHSQTKQKLVTNRVMYRLIIRAHISFSCELTIITDHEEKSVDKLGKQYTHVHPPHFSDN